MYIHSTYVTSTPEEGRHLIKYTAALSKYLQLEDCDLVKAATNATNMVDTLNNKRGNDDLFNNIYNDAISFANNWQIDITTKRTGGCQIHRPNAPFTSAVEHYKINTYIPMLDYLITELRDRLCRPSPRMEAQYLIPAYSNLMTVDLWQSIKETYSSFLEDPLAADAEYEVYMNDVAAKKVNSDNLKGALLETYGFYPNIYNILKVLLTMPVSTATVERSFSSLRRLKTYLRSTMID